MRPVPEDYLSPALPPGRVSTLHYGNKFALLYTPASPADRILYLIHGGGGDQYAFFCPAFLNMIDHMIASGALRPLYIVSPCFYDPDAADKRPAASGRAVAVFCDELRHQIMPLAEQATGRTFDRSQRIISGFSMGGVTTWYAFMQALDLFSRFLPLSGDCWACGETGGGRSPDATAAKLAEALRDQGHLPFRIHCVTGSADIACPNITPQIEAMRKYPQFGEAAMRYTVFEGGVHDYETIFMYLYNALPGMAE